MPINYNVSMKKATSFLLFLLAAVVSCAQDSRTGYNFLRVPVSAHAAALGGDNISIAEDDETLIFNNPALLSSVSGKTISLNYMNFMAGVNTLSAAFNMNLRERSSAALSVQYADYGKMKQTDVNNADLGSFTAKDIAISGYFSYMLSDHWAGGITAKLITSHIAGYSSVATGFDLGLNYYNADNGFSLSLVAKNLGGQLKPYDNVYEKMPTDIQVGFSKQPEHMPARISVSLVDLTRWDYRFANHLVCGVDVLLSRQIWLGAGYNFRRAREMTINQSDENENNHGAGFSFGAGLNLDRFQLNLAYGKYHISSRSLVINLAYSM